MPLEGGAGVLDRLGRADGGEHRVVVEDGDDARKSDDTRLDLGPRRD
jgi:hypothetical protein